MADNKGLSPQQMQELQELEELDALEQQFANQPTAPSKLQSFGKGAQAGATLGFSDELSGGVQSALDRIFGVSAINKQLADQGFTGDIGPTNPSEVYTQGRDEERKALNQAQAANPTSFLAGEFAGGMALPAGAAAKGATLGTKAIRGAVAGGLGGGATAAGTAQEMPSIGDVAQGAAIGATAGAALPAVGAGLGKLGSVASNVQKSMTGSETVGDLLKAFRLGKQGQGIGRADTKAAGESLVAGVEGLSEDIANTGRNLAKDRAAALKAIPDKFDTRFVQEQLEARGQDKLLPVGNQGKDRETLQRLAQELQSNAVSRQDMSAEEVQKLKKLINDMKYPSMNPQAQNLATSEGQNIAGSLAQDLDKMLSSPSVKEPNQKMSDILSTLEDLGLEKISENDLGSSALSSKLYDTFSKSLTDSSAGYKASDRLTKLQDMLKRVNPELANEAMPQLKQLAEQVDLGLKSQNTALTVNPLKYVKASANQAANIVGKALKPKEQTDMMYDTVKSLSSNEGIQSKIADLTAKGKTAGANLLKKIAESSDNERTRNALLFSTLQNPTYRAEILDTPQEQDDGGQ